MPLITDESDESIDAKKIRARAEIAAITKRTYQIMLTAHRQGMYQFWNNPNGLTPQQVADAIGTDCAALFAFNSKLVELIQLAASHDGLSPNLLAPTQEFTVNEDGTVTISV